MRFKFVSTAFAATFLLFGGMSTTAVHAQGLNPCPYQNDGDCDEPNGLNLCAWHTDPGDCSNPNANYANGPGFSAGVYGSSRPQQVQLQNPCPYQNDGDCDEPNGLNLCAWGTDPGDCSNPNSNYANGAGFLSGVYTNQSRPQQPTTTTGGRGGVFTSHGGGGVRGCPNWATQRTAFGGTTLNAGFGSFRVPRITAGGRHAVANCFSTNWRGFTITRPDYRMHYRGNSPTGRLVFQLTSNATDTILLINAPDGQWYFNDDSNGTFNSTLVFAPALQGQYDIWAGSYNLSSNNRAQMWISE